MNLTCRKVSNTKPEANAAVHLPLHSRCMCPSLLLKPILIHFNLFKTDINVNDIKNSVPTLHKTQSITNISTNQLILFRQMIV